MNGDKLANVIALADFRRGRFAVIFQILRRESDGNERKNACLVADRSFAIYDDVRSSRTLSPNVTYHQQSKKLRYNNLTDSAFGLTIALE
jgi:hypothetical protein